MYQTRFDTCGHDSSRILGNTNLCYIRFYPLPNTFWSFIMDLGNEPENHLVQAIDVG